MIRPLSIDHIRSKVLLLQDNFTMIVRYLQDDEIKFSPEN
jgi:hypothetical protein